MDIEFLVTIAYVLLLLALNIYTINTVYVSIRYVLHVMLHGRPNFIVPDTYKPSVTFHIPIYNEKPEMIRTLLSSIAFQDYPKEKIEIVIIDQSDDPFIKKAIKTVVSEFQQVHSIPLKYVMMDRFGDGITTSTQFKPGALNLAARLHTSNDLIVVVDGDSYIDPNFLKHGTKHFYRKEIGLVMSRHVIPYNDIISRWIRVTKNLLFLLGEIKTALGYPHTVIGNGVIIRREICEQIEWDTQGEDIYMSLIALAHGWKIWFESKSITYDEGIPDNIKALKKQWRRIVYGQGQAIKKVLSTPSIRWKVLKDFQITIQLFSIVALILPLALFPLNFILYYLDINIDNVLAFMGIFIGALTAFTVLLLFITVIRFGYPSDIFYYPLMLFMAIHYLVPGAIAFVYIIIGKRIVYYRTQRTGEIEKTSIHDFEVVEFLLLLASIASMILFFNNFGAVAFFAIYFVMMFMSFINYTVKSRPTKPIVALHDPS